MTGEDRMGETAGNGDGGVRRATREEVDWLIELAAREGWNPGRDDAAAFHAADPEGFLVAVAADDRPLAGISVVRQDDGFGFLGLYIARPEARGRGHGWRVWQAGLAHLGERTVGLDGVPAQQSNYRRSGFEPCWRNLRFAGALAPAASGSADASDPPDASGADAVAGHDASDARAGAPRRLDAATLESALALDRAVGGVSRERFLRHWLADSATRRTLCLVEAGRVVALGTIRDCREHCKIGPLIAGDVGRAETLLRALAAARDAEGIVLDVPEDNAAGVALARALGLETVFETARMYRGAPPRVDRRRLFGVATLELG